MTTLEDIRQRAIRITEDYSPASSFHHLAGLVRALCEHIERSTPPARPGRVEYENAHDRERRMLIEAKDARIAELETMLREESRIEDVKRIRDLTNRAEKAESTLADAHAMLAGYVQRGMALDAAVAESNNLRIAWRNTLDHAEARQRERDEARAALAAAKAERGDVPDDLVKVVIDEEKKSARVLISGEGLGISHGWTLVQDVEQDDIDRARESAIGRATEHAQKLTEAIRRLWPRPRAAMTREEASKEAWEFFGRIGYVNAHSLVQLLLETAGRGVAPQAVEHEVTVEEPVFGGGAYLLVDGARVGWWRQAKGHNGAAVAASELRTALSCGTPASEAAEIQKLRRELHAAAVGNQRLRKELNELSRMQPAMRVATSEAAPTADVEPMPSDAAILANAKAIRDCNASLCQSIERAAKWEPRARAWKACARRLWGPSPNVALEVAEAYARGRDEERSRVVAFARQCAANNATLTASVNPDVRWRADRDARMFAFIADQIERGEHEEGGTT